MQRLEAQVHNKQLEWTSTRSINTKDAIPLLPAYSLLSFCHPYKSTKNNHYINKKHQEKKITKKKSPTWEKQKKFSESENVKIETKRKFPAQSMKNENRKAVKFFRFSFRGSVTSSTSVSVRNLNNRSWSI